MDLSISPEQYKKLWWGALIDEMVKTKKVFTIPELQKFAEEKLGSPLPYNNFHRAALNNAPIFKTGIETHTIGRPAMYYCSNKI